MKNLKRISDDYSGIISSNVIENIQNDSNYNNMKIINDEPSINEEEIYKKILELSKQPHQK